MDDGAGPPPATGAPARRREARLELLTFDPPRSGHPNLESAEAPMEHSRGRRHRHPQRPTTAPLEDCAANPDPQFRADVERSRRRRPALRPYGTHSQPSSSSAPPIDCSAADPDPPASDAGVRGCSVPDLLIPSELVISRRRRRPQTGPLLFQHHGAEGWGAPTPVRQSVLYSGRLRRLQRRPEPTPTEEHPGELGSSEVGMAATDLSKFEALSLSDPSVSTSQIPEESDDDCPRFNEHAGDASSSVLGPTVNVPSRPVAVSMSDSSFIPQSTKEKPTKDSEADKEESLRLLREYFLENPPTSFSQAFAKIKAVEDATLATLAAERGTVPSPLRTPPPVDQKAQSGQGQDHASAAVAHPECIATRQPRQSDEASMEEIIENGKKWMCDEVMMCFGKYVERRSKLEMLEYHLDELCHQCFTLEDYNKNFHHYNFKVNMRKSDSVEWTVRLYFAEVKEIFRRKYYFCCPLEPNENGHCYACLKQGVKDLMHPATGGFEMGFTDATLFGYSEE